MDEQFIIGVWDVFKEYITPKNMEAAATHFVDFLVDQDVETEVLSSIQGMDSNLDEAIKNVLADEESYEEYEDDDYTDEDY